MRGTVRDDGREESEGEVSVVAKLDGMIAGLREHRAEVKAREVVRPSNAMVDAVLSGELGRLRAENERLRSDAALQAIVVAGLGEKLAEAREANAALSNDCVEVAECFGNEDTTGGESLGDYVARRMAHGAGLVRQLDGGGLTTGQRMELMRELHQFFAAALNDQAQRARGPEVV